MLIVMVGRRREQAVMKVCPAFTTALRESGSEWEIHGQRYQDVSGVRANSNRS